MMPKGRAGQLQPSEGPHYSLRTFLRAELCVYTYIENRRGGDYTRKLLFTNRYAKVRVSERVAGCTQFGKTQK